LPSPEPDELELQANGLRFHALTAGPTDAPLVLLLHGFPELARSWRHQLPVLEQAGYRAVAPDLRGYGETERRGPYGLRTLAADVASLVRALGHDRAAVVGHDWGGAAAWIAAARHPDAVERLAVLNSPHPHVLARELVRNPRQLRRSTYLLAYQLPWWPERVLTRDGAHAIGRILVGGSHVRSAWPETEIERYQEAFLRPGAAAAALAWYRAAFRRPLVRVPRIAAPTLVLWGVHDRFLGEELIAPDRLARVLAPGNVPEVRRIEDAGHFVQNEAPGRVNQELLRWLAGERPESQGEGPHTG
jgi:epoxide hydrolase 4